MNLSILTDANQLLRQGKFEEAIDTYKKAIHQNPQFAWSHHCLGEALAKVGRLEEATAAFRQAVTINPQSACSHHYLGEALAKVGRLEEATAAFRQAVTINPQSAWPLYRLGELLSQQNQLEEAVDYIHKAIDSEKNVPSFYLCLGIALVKLERWSEAEKYLEKVIQFSSNCVAQIDTQTNDYPNQIPTAYQAEAYYNLGKAKSGQQKWSEAIELYRQSWDLKPTIDCCLNLGVVLEKLEQWSEVVECYRQGMLVFGESGQVLFNLAQALEHLEHRNVYHLIYEADSLVDQNANIDAYFHLNLDVKQAVSNDIKAGLEHWHNHGCMEGRILPGVRPFIHRKTNPQKLNSKDFGINFYGPLSAFSGLGTAARGYVSSLEKAKITYKIVGDNIYDYSNQDLQEFRARTRVPNLDSLMSKQYRINILHYNADAIDRFFKILPMEILDNCYNIGIWTWELPSFRSDWFQYFGAVDEVWVPSNFVRDALASIAPVPVITMPHCIELELGNGNYDRSHFGIPEDAFVFSYIFDVSSHILRKNPFALVEAFEKAFPGNSKAVLALKFHSGQHNPEAVKKLRNLATRNRNIKIFSRFFSEAELISFKMITDCLVSPHRSEGFGLNIAEAMYLGQPVIATNFSSNTDFMNADNSYPLKYQLTAIENQSGPYLPGYVWAEPSIEHLTELMIEVFENRKEALERGQEAANLIRQNYSAEAIGNLISQRISELGLEEKSTTSFLQWGTSKEVMAFDPFMFVDEEQVEGKRILSMSSHPTISVIVSVHNIESEYLIKCIESVKNQTYPFWEICLCNERPTNSETVETLESYRGTDPRIKINYLPKNLGIAGATNTAVKFSTGSFLAFLDNDDELAPDALMEVAETINTNPKVDYIYTDEDKIDLDGSHVDTYYKPDWSPEHLESMMYVSHLIVIRKSLFYELGGMREQFSGAQDYDLALRATRNTSNIVHIPKILYHWRKIPGSACVQVNAKPKALIAAKEALQEHIQVHYQGTAEVVDGKLPGIFRVKHQLLGTPTVTLLILTHNSIVEIPGRGKVYLVDNFIRSILEKTDYPNYRILVVDDQNTDVEQMQKYKDYGVSLVSYTGAQKFFNFASKANFSFSQVNSELLVLLNDDMEVISSEWLGALIEFAQSPEIGTVGGKLLHANGTIQHVGVVAGVNNGCAHLYHGHPRDTIGYNGYTHLIRNYATLTGACLATRKSVIEEVGGFDEVFAIDYNDTDFCLSALENGYRNVYTPYCELYHFEGMTATRKSQNLQEVELFQTRWKKYFENDPYYNVNLSRSRIDFSLI